MTSSTPLQDPASGAPRPGLERFLPALGVLLAAVAVLLVRPAVPLDETRYLEVARELGDGGSPLLLHENGEPYSHKPPLLFWLGALLGADPASGGFGMRLIPALAVALTVLLTGSLGRRLGVPEAGWVQAAMLLPLLSGQVLLVDSLFCCCLWAALLAWVRARDALAWILLTAALLTKGPVGLAFFPALAWALLPLRGRPGLGRLTLVTLGGVLVLGGWALSAAATGGPAFQQELLVDQTLGRVSSSFAHAHGPWFYIPVVLLGTLPVTPLLFRRPETPALRRMPGTLLVIVLFFSFVSGKQPHYLLPLGPAASLWAADVLRRRGRVGWPWLLPATLALGLLLAPFFPFRLLDPVLAAQMSALRTDPLWWSLVVAGAAASTVLTLRLLRWRGAPRAALVALGLVVPFLLLPLHRTWGRLSYPGDLARGLAEVGDAPVATYRFHQAGLINWLTGRSSIVDLQDERELATWCREHPGGYVVRRAGAGVGDSAGTLEDLLGDRVGQREALLSRVVAPRPVEAVAPREEPTGTSPP